MSDFYSGTNYETIAAKHGPNMVIAVTILVLVLTLSGYIVCVVLRNKL